MRKINILILFSALVLSNSSAYALITPVENKPRWKAQVFMANQIKGIGLVDSYQEDNENRSYVYDNALAAIACVRIKNFGLAKEILDTLIKEVQKAPAGVPFEQYDYTDLNGNGSGSAYCGNTAWLLQALNIYQKFTGSKRYYRAQKNLADFLLTLQDPNDGGLRGSTYEYWKSTEHNLVAYVAIRNFGHLNRRAKYIVKSNRIRVFLKSQAVWDGAHFNRGPNDLTKVTDCQSLGVLVFGIGYANALDWAETNLKLSKPFNLETVTGFDFNSDLDTVWLEGTLQMALAFYKINNAAQGNYYFNEARKTIQGDGSVVLATNTGTASQYWTMQPWRAIAPTAWLVFYALRFNPLIQYSH